MAGSLIACSTFPFQGLPLDQTFKRLRELGFLHADVSIHFDPAWGHVTSEQAQREPLAVLELFEAARAASGVGVGAITLGTNIQAVGERGQVEAVVKLARRIGAPVVSVVAGDRDEALELRRLRDYVALAADHGVALCLETFGGSAAIRPATAVEWAEGLPGLGLTLDTGHLLSRGVRQPDWAPLWPHVRHVHVKDAGLTPDRYQVPFGEGALDLAGLVRSLEEARYAGAYTVEYIGPRSEDMRRFDAEPEIRKLRAALVAGLGGARN